MNAWDRNKAARAHAAEAERAEIDAIERGDQEAIAKAADRRMAADDEYIAADDYLRECSE